MPGFCGKGVGTEGLKTRDAKSLDTWVLSPSPSPLPFLWSLLLPCPPPPVISQPPSLSWMRLMQHWTTPTLERFVFGGSQLSRGEYLLTWALGEDDGC